MNTGLKALFVIVGFAVIGAGFYFFSMQEEGLESAGGNEVVENRGETQDVPPSTPFAEEEVVSPNSEPAQNEEAETLPVPQTAVPKTEETPIAKPPPTVRPPAPAEPQEHIVRVYSFTDWRPASLIIYAGDTVTFINEDEALHWPGADPHPTHSSLPDFDALGGISKGQSYSHTFRKPGVYGHHDHLLETPPTIGTITVLPRE